MPTYRNHAEEIEAALRAASADARDVNARTLVGSSARSSTPPPESKTEPTSEPAHDLHFAKSVLAMHLDRLYRGRRDDRGLGAEQAEEIRAAVDSIVTEGVKLSRVKPNVSPHAVAQHIDLHAVAHLLRPGIAREIDLQDLAAVLMPLVLPEIERQACAVVTAKRAQAEMPAPKEPPTWESVGNRMSNAGPHAQRKFFTAFVSGLVDKLGDEATGLLAMTLEGLPEDHRLLFAAALGIVAPSIHNEPLDSYAINKVSELRGALEFLLALDLKDLNDRYAHRAEWSPEYRVAVGRAERVLGVRKAAPPQQYRGPDTNGCQHPDERPVFVTDGRTAMVWEQLAGDSKTARILNCSACGHDHARVQGVKRDRGGWGFVCPVRIVHVTLPDFPEIPW